MRIKKIELKNGYKRFKNLTINLGDNPAKIIALIGPNGCGKSSVFDGMVFKASVYHSIGQFGNKDFNFHSMDKDPNYNQNNIEIEFDKGNFETVFDVTRQATREGTMINFRNSYRFNPSLNIKNLTSIPDIKRNSAGASSSIDLDDKMTENYQRLYVYLNQFRKDNNLTDIQAKEQIIDKLNTILKKCLGLEIVDEGDIIAGRGTLYFIKEDQPKPFEYNVLSSGEKEVVDILLDIFLKRNQYTDTIYIIDEPELHLNTGIQKNLLLEIEKLIPDTCQVWVATHSIGFLNALQNELNDKCSIIEFKGNFGNSEVTLKPMVKNRINWQKLSQVALEDLTGLIAPKNIVYCEGRIEPDEENNEQGFDAEVYNNIFAETHPDTLFISSGGHTQPDQYASVALKVLNKAFKDVKLFLLKDKDINSNGTETTEEQRESFLAENKMNRMLKRKEIENYLLDYEIIVKAYPTIDRAAYEALIPDISGEVRKKSGEIMGLCGIYTGKNISEFSIELSNHVIPGTNVYKELEKCIFGDN